MTSADELPELVRRDDALDSTPFRLKFDPKYALRRHHQRIKNYIPTYKRKAVHAHKGNDTLHHFASYPGYNEIQKLHHHRKEQESKHQDEMKLEKDAQPATAVARDLPSLGNAAAIVSQGQGAYKLVNEYSGASFFDKWVFYTADDPTGGMIQYVNKKEAEQAGLIGLKNGNAFMKIGNGNNGIQKSVRISTKDSFTGGILMLDAYHMPTGCG